MSWSEFCGRETSDGAETVVALQAQTKYFIGASYFDRKLIVSWQPKESSVIFCRTFKCCLQGLTHSKDMRAEY